MKKFLHKIWVNVNSPMFDIVGGCFMVFGGILGCYTYSELSIPCVFAFISGCLITMGLDAAENGFRRRKSSGSPDENNNDK